MAVAPYVGRCDAEDCDRDDPEITIWQEVEPGNHYARCYSCGRIRYVERSYEGRGGNPFGDGAVVVDGGGDE